MRSRSLLFAAAFAAGFCASAAGQELEPRSYSPSPVGLNFIVAAYGYSTGSVIFDPSLPITDVKAQVNGLALGYGRTFGLFGRQALATVALPYGFGDMSGMVFEQAKAISRSGLADVRAKFSINLYGNPAQTPGEFAQTHREDLLIGASLSLTAPTGQYSGDKLVNIGTNRWSFKPEIGIAFPWKGFSFETYVGVVVFTQNSNFFPGGQLRQQDPLGTVQAHASYTFLPGLWLALDGTWYGGGASSVNGGPKSTRLSDTRLGTTLSLPTFRAQSLKISFSKGAVVRAGSNFTTVGAAWQVRWF